MNLRMARERKGFTRQQLADLVFIDPRMILRYEQGEATPNVRTAQRISQALDTDINSIDW